MNKTSIKKTRLPLVSEMIRHLDTAELRRVIAGAASGEEIEVVDVVRQDPNIYIVKAGCTSRPG